MERRNEGGEGKEIKEKKKGRRRYIKAHTEDKGS